MESYNEERMMPFKRADLAMYSQKTQDVTCVNKSRFY